jgi:hypothetical protein
VFNVLIYGQDEVPELVTDRPDQTEASRVVPAGTLQLETGFIVENKETNLEKQRALVYNTSLFRYGLSKRFELRLGLAYLENRTEFKEMDSVHTVHGFSPLYTGFKIQILEEDGWIPETALIGGLVLPFSAAEEFKPQNTGVGMRFSMSHTLSNRFSLGYNLGAEYLGESSAPWFFYSVALGAGITDRLGMYIEGFGWIPEQDIPSHLFDGGFTYLVTPVFQLDISAGFGLNEEALDNYLSAGLTFRLPR